ncbi:MAG: helicase, partial [Sphingobium limneticum]
GRSMTLPRATVQPVKNDGQELNEFGKSIWDLLSHAAGAKYEKELAKFTKPLDLIDSGTPNQAEAGMRALGELLGFTSTRPDNDEGIGPDVLWRDEKNAQMLAFELKTDKDEPGTYSKDDIGQGHNHIEWLEKNHSDFELLGLLFVGPEGVASNKASPSEEMGLCCTASAVTLRDAVLALVEDMRKKTPMERFIAIKTETDRPYWNLEKIHERLHDKEL